MANTSSLLLSVIVVSYNTPDLTIQTLTSVIREITASHFLNGKTDVYIIDNDSHDDSVARIRQFVKDCHYPLVKVIENSKNLGFAGANNQALRLSQAKYCLLLNSDTIVQKKALELLVKTMEKVSVNEETANSEEWGEKIDKLGVLSATLVNPDGSFQPQGGSLPALHTIASQMLFLDDLPWIGHFFPSTQHTGMSDFAFQTYRRNLQRLIPKDWVGGTAMLLRKSMLDEIGLLDENIFMYGEDQELCMRAKNHHFDVAIHPQATITHFGSASSSSKNAILGEFKGYLYIFQKHKPHWQLPILKALLFLGASLRILFYNGTHQPLQTSIYQEARALLK